MRTDTVVDLVTDAYDLVRHHADGGGQVVAEAALLRDQLRERLATEPDGGDLSADLEAVAAELDDLLGRAERLPQQVAALTG